MRSNSTPRSITPRWHIAQRHELRAQVLASHRHPRDERVMLQAATHRLGLVPRDANAPSHGSWRRPSAAGIPIPTGQLASPAKSRHLPARTRSAVRCGNRTSEADGIVCCASGAAPSLTAPYHQQPPWRAQVHGSGTGLGVDSGTSRGPPVRDRLGHGLDDDRPVRISERHCEITSIDPGGSTAP